MGRETVMLPVVWEEGEFYPLSKVPHDRVTPPTRKIPCVQPRYTWSHACRDDWAAPAFAIGTKAAHDLVTIAHSLLLYIANR